MSIVALRLEGKEECFLRETKRTAVGKYKADVCVLVTITACADERRYFLNSIIHYYLYFFISLAKVMKSLNTGLFYRLFFVISLKIISARTLRTESFHHVVD